MGWSYRRVHGGSGLKRRKLVQRGLELAQEQRERVLLEAVVEVVEHVARHGVETVVQETDLSARTGSVKQTSQTQGPWAVPVLA